MVDISFIVPVYNTEIKKIIRCLNSIRRVASYLTIEIIVVDDGSEGFIEDFFINYENENIRYIRKSNGGVSSARNVGLKYATGRYVFFSDADDEIISSVFYDFNKINRYNNYELIIYDLSLVSGKKTIRWNSINSSKGKIDKKTILKAIATTNSMNSPCGKLFLREVLIKNNIKFNENMITAEDLNFVIDFIHNSEYFFYFNTIAYIYYREEKSRINRIKIYPDIYLENCNYINEKILKVIGDNNMCNKTLIIFDNNRVEGLYNYTSDLLMLKLFTMEREKNIQDTLKKIRVLHPSLKQKIKYHLLLTNNYGIIKILAYIRILYLKLKG